MDTFWSDKTAGIDYKSFLRIFAKYEIKVQNEDKARSTKRPKTMIKDEIILLKKRMFTKLDEVLRAENMTVKNLFQKVDADGSYEID